MEKLYRLPDGHLFVDLIRATDVLLAESRAVLTYPHPEGRGAGREAILQSFLTERLPKSVSASKAVIRDSLCNSAGEFDIVLYDPNARLLLGRAVNGRDVIPVEAVRCVIEVRTTIDLSAVRDAQEKASKLFGLRRFFVPSRLGHEYLRVVPGSPANVGAGEPWEWLPAIRVLLVGFNGIESETMARHLAEEGTNLDCVIALGQYAMFRRPEIRVAEFDVVGIATGLFLLHLTSLLQEWDSVPLTLGPDWTKYFELPDVGEWSEVTA